MAHYFPKIFKIIVIYQLALSAIYIWNMSWGYDELGAITTINEFSSVKIQNFYRDILSERLNLPDIFVNLAEKILPFFLVPIRWTYSLGLSPFYYPIISLQVTDPNIQRLLVFVPHLISIALSFFLINRSEALYDEKIRLIFILLIFCSNSFMYWTLTLSSYGLILLGFSLLLLFSEQSDCRRQNLILGAICLLNYQYFPIVTALILIESRFKIAELSRYWLPISIMFISSVWIWARGKFFSVHDAATNSNLSLDEQFNLSEIVEIQSVAERFFDVLRYIATGGSQVKLDPSLSDGVVDYLSMSFLLVLIVSVCFWHWRKYYSRFTGVCVLMVLLQSILWITGLTPFVGSRHNLIIYLPVLYLVSFPILRILEKKFKILNLALMIFAISFTTHNFLLFSSDRRTLNHSLTFDLISAPNVSHVVLSRCNLEIPSWSLPPQIRENIYYRCGDQRIMGDISIDDVRHLIYIGAPASLQEISNEIASFGLGYAEVQGIQSLSSVCLDALPQSDCENRVEIISVKQ